MHLVCSWISKVTLGILLSYTFASPGHANPNCFTEGSNNWERCAATCSAACREPSIDLRSARNICERLARREKATLKDDASCATILGKRPETPSFDTCLAKAKDKPSFADLLKNLETPEIRDPVGRLLENPPSVSKVSKFACGPKPAALKSMYDCVRQEASEIDAAMRPLQAEPQSSDDKGLCGRSFSENEKSHRVLVTLQKRAARLKTTLDTGLKECNEEWTHWLSERSATKNREDGPLDQGVADLIDELIKDIGAELRQANATKSKADEIINGVGASLKKIQVEILRAMFKC